MGVMGVVYRAHDVALRRIVALKVLRAEGAESSGRRLRFLREARAASLVNHENIAGVYEVGEAEGTAFIAMELVEGKSLRARLREAPLALPEALRLARAIAAALAKAHAAGVIHRDLKPENVMLSVTGVVKVLDFGLARQTNRSSTDSDDSCQTLEQSLTAEHGMLGTPGYMSPEQVLGHETTPRSDVFAFGLVLHELLTGRRAFDRATHMETAVSICRDPAPSLGRSAPRWLASVVERCLQKDPELRFADCAAVGAALDAPRSRRAGLVMWSGAALGLAFFIAQARAQSTQAAVAPPTPENQRPAAARTEHTPPRAALPTASGVQQSASASPAPAAPNRRASVRSAAQPSSPGSNSTPPLASSERDLLHYRE